LDKTIKLLDCPGVVFSKNDPDSLILKNVIRVEDLNEPIEIVDLILRKIDKLTLIEVYEIPEFNNCSEFLASVARKRGKLIKVKLCY
jgi:nuclear GTP-binding protein